ncbi:MAG: UvrD-helicase domain-containing protein [Candidatus Helarchaeota archaeon]
MTIQKIKGKPKIVIAGPGAGKTHDMVIKIIELLPQLKPNRILAAITFTNAATDSIREKLCKLTQIPPNIFIGTNYSFFNKYIFRPFASLFDHVPFDQLFFELDMRELVEKKAPRNSNPVIKNVIRKRITESLLKNGKIPFEQIANISNKLIKDRKVREIISNRIQFLLIDEFQDIDTIQFRIFDEIRKGRKTSMYLVGDPEQYILSFTYGQRSVKKPSYNKIPINKYVSLFDMSTNDKNKRSCKKIVEFNNNFHTSIKQKSNVKDVVKSGVFFLDIINLDLIILKFIELTRDLINKDNKFRRFFLGFEKKTFQGYVEKYGLIQISNDNKRPKSILNESLELITSATQLSSIKIRENYNLNAVEYRRLGIKLLNAIISKKVEDIDGLKIFIERELGLLFIAGAVKLEPKLNSLINLLKFEKTPSNKDYYSSIHKAKGLEAECVLIVSKNTNELKKWLETDYNVRCEDKIDTCRIGYVGFTRPKYMLFISCKQPIDTSIRKNLIDLNVEIIQ